MKILIIILSLIFIGKANATTEIKFGGWSKHLNSDSIKSSVRKHIDPDFEYNENHQGLGLKYTFDCDDWCYFSEYWYMKESYDNPFNSITLGVSKHYDSKYVSSIELNVGASLVRRSFFESNNKFATKNSILPTAYLTFHERNYNVDFTVNVNKSAKGQIMIIPFVRFGYRF